MREVRLGRVLLVAAASALIPLAGNVIASVVTDWTGRASWLVVPAVGVVVAMIAAVVDAYGSATPPGQGGTPLIAAILIAVVVIGIGGLGVAAGTRSLLITAADLPEGYVVSIRERSSSLSVCASNDGRLTAYPAVVRTMRTKLSALGLESCEVVQYRFRDPASGNTNRPTSQAYVVRDADAASELLPVLRKLMLSTFDPGEDAVEKRRHSLPALGLGDESPRGATLSFSHLNTGETATLWVYWWRRGNAVAWLMVSDAVGDFDSTSTLELARAIDARMD